MNPPTLETVNTQFDAMFDTPRPADNELWNAKPDCDHEIEAAPGGGIRCTKCPGWYCY